MARPQSTASVPSPTSIVVGRDGRIQTWSDEASLITGVTAPDAIGRELASVLDGTPVQITLRAAPEGFRGVLSIDQPTASQPQHPDGFASAVLDSLPHQICVLDDRGVIRAVNAAWCRFGRSNSVPTTPDPSIRDIGTSYLDVCRRADPETDPEALMTASGLESILRGERDELVLEYPCDSPDERRWFLLHAMRLVAPLRGVLIAHHDITLRKSAEEAAQSGETLRRDLLDSLSTFVAVLDVAGHVRYVNRAPLDVVGLVQADVLGRPFSAMPWWGPSSREQVRAAVEAAAAGHSLRFDAPYDARGETRIIDVQAGPIRNAAGAIIYIMVSGVDISERSRSEAALRESERRLHVALDAARAGAFVWEVEQDRVIRYHSPEPNLPPNIHQPVRFSEVLPLIHPDDRAGFQARVEAILASGSSYENAYRVLHPDGSVRWYEERGLLERFADGRPHRLLGIATDVTERMLYENRVVAQNRVLERIAAGEPTGEVLVDIVRMVESALPGAVCAIRRADRAAQCLRLVAGPSLEPAFAEACVEIPIGPGMGPCGTAAYSGKPVVTADTMLDPLWDGLHDIAALGHVRSCVSQPVHASGNVSGLPAGSVLATLAVYGREPHARSVLSVATHELLGQAVHLVGLALERELSVTALQESEGKFRDVLEMSPNLVYLKDLSSRYQYVNRRTVELTGIPAAQWVGKTARELLPADIADRFDEHDRAVLDSGLPRQLEETVMLGGQPGTFLSTQFLLRRADGQPYALCGITADVTQRRVAEQERARLWNETPDPLCVASLDGRILEVNPSWERVLGYPPAELVGRNLGDLVHPDDCDEYDKTRRALVQGRTATGVIYRWIGKNGEPRWLSWNLMPQVESGRIYGFARDITEQRSLEGQLQQAQKMEAIGQLAGGVAHDFNNLLTIINGYSELLLESPIAQGAERELISDVRDAGLRARSLTAQLLAFSRKAIVEPRVLSVDAAVASVARMLQRLIGENIELVTELHAQRNVRIDPSQLEQVLINLAVNARDAMPRGGKLAIRTTCFELAPGPMVEAASLQPGPHVEIVVSDTGIGMSEDVKRHLFEPFFTTKGVGKGTGLGLATVYGIVRQAAGAVTLQSEVGVGTTFRIVFPVAAENSDAETHEPAPPRRGKETVLLVEDEDSVRRFTQRVLERQGYRVIAASNGEAALSVARRHTGPIDLVLSDVVMPGMSGHEVTTAVRALHPSTRVLYMSGYANDDVVRNGIETARDAFVQKPFTLGSLLAKVREVLDGGP